ADGVRGARPTQATASRTRQRGTASRAVIASGRRRGARGSTAVTVRSSGKLARTYHPRRRVARNGSCRRTARLNRGTRVVYFRAVSSPRTPERISPDAAAALVRSGDWVDYGFGLGQPDLF